MAASTDLPIHGDLNNTQMMRTAEGEQAELAPDSRYSHVTLEIPESEDDAEIRRKYRPFLLDPEIAKNDWVSRLELSAATKVVLGNLDVPDPTLESGTTEANGDGKRAVEPVPYAPGVPGLPGGRERLRVLVLYGSLRSRSFSRLAAYEASRVLWRLGCDVRVYSPEGLPVKDDVQHLHPKVQELRELSKWSDGHLWVSPEQHGNLVRFNHQFLKAFARGGRFGVAHSAQTAVFKNQIDWIPLSMGSVRPTQGRTLAIAQVNGGSQSFNAVNSLRILGRWMRMFAIPNQSSVPQAWTHFTDPDAEEGGNRMKPSGNRARLVDCMEELVKYTIVMRPHFYLFGDRHSEREEKKAKEEKERKAEEEKQSRQNETS
ncbi:arsenate resistance ArsH [Zalerion maritima]|uniref:Arsenate resistance ArsH n=1 Tax=Zalerion maritima TaxID=339359 RepID=A0AAD5RKS4_9PEZI|nr:arsenate resistance ArsH [Zalerion maritima]